MFELFDLAVFLVQLQLVLISLALQLQLHQLLHLLHGVFSGLQQLFLCLGLELQQLLTQIFELFLDELPFLFADYQLVFWVYHGLGASAVAG